MPENQEGDDDNRNFENSGDGSDDREKTSKSSNGSDDRNGHNEKNGDKDGDKAGENAGDKDEKPKKRSKLPFIIGGIILLIAIIAGVIYWLLTRNLITTDDAYTDGNSVSISSNVSGYVTELGINDNQFVRAGQLLMIIDPRSNLAQYAQSLANEKLAEANLRSAQIDLQEEVVRAPAQYAQAQAQLLQARGTYADAQRNFNRQLDVDQRATAQTQVDQTTEQLISAKAQVQQAQANLAVSSLVKQNIASSVEAVAQRQAQLAQAKASLYAAKTALSYNYIRAPQDGWITMRNVDLGTYVQAGTQVFFIVAKTVWITANYKETQLNGMAVGQHVTISVDAFPALALKGHIQSMQEGSGAVFSAFPAENATGNFVKIVRRVPIKILIDSGLPPSLPILPLGISVEPTVHLP